MTTFAKTLPRGFEISSTSLAGSNCVDDSYLPAWTVDALNAVTALPVQSSILPELPTIAHERGVGVTLALATLEFALPRLVGVPQRFSQLEVEDRTTLLSWMLAERSGSLAQAVKLVDKVLADFGAPPLHARVTPSP
ncbi:MAG: hypothetical protein JWN70_1480, partial [Planctomycetaceae bacterium]|nr:hypothetical protein [Planctomycetaceae bacterium]